MKIDPKFYAKGLRFECTGCGNCCKARHGYGYIYMTLPERRRMAAHLGLKTAVFTRTHCDKTNGFHHLRHPSKDCQFLDGTRCTVYAARPEQCRTWPFWPENMNKREWNGPVKRDCPGIGIGKRHSAAEIEPQLRAEVDRSHRN